MDAKKIISLLEEDPSGEHKRLDDELHALNKEIKAIKAKYPKGAHVDTFSGADFHKHSELVVKRGHLWDKIEKIERAAGTYKGY